MGRGAVLALISVVATVSSACRPTPSSPSVTNVPPSSIPIVPLAIASSSIVPIQGVSTVTFSTPLALRDAVYSLTFGDGDSDVMYPPIGLSQVTRAWHTYRTSGEFTAQLTVTGANGGRLATGSTTVTVRSLAGAWSNTDVNNATNRSEARRFELTQQGSALSGRYLGPDGVARAAAGTLSAERSIRLTVDGQMVASGIDLDRDGISDDASAFTVVFAGLGATGRRLTFVREK